MLEKVNPSSEVTTKVNELIEQAKEYLSASKADNTKKAYGNDWIHFSEWCMNHQFTSLPATPETVILYITEVANEFKFSTIRRRLASISQAHKAMEHTSPVSDFKVQQLLKGIGKTNGIKQDAKEAVLLDDLKMMIDKIDTTKLIGIRDKALLLLGFATASRRSELVAINVEDIKFTKRGMEIAIKQTKTDDEPITKAVLAIDNEYCPVEAVKNWMESARLLVGALFPSINRHGHLKDRMTDKAVALIVKKYVELTGLDPKQYAGHSLRSGLATSAAQLGMNDSSIMKQTGHRTRNMVDRYVQDGQRYKNNASSILGKL